MVVGLSGRGVMAEGHRGAKLLVSPGLGSRVPTRKRPPNSPLPPGSLLTAHATNPQMSMLSL